MKTTLRWGLGLAAVVVIAGAGQYGWTRYRAAQTPPAELTLFGNVDVRAVTLAFRVPGRLMSVAAEEGDRIAPGDVIAMLEPTDFSDQRDLARAGVDAGAAALAMLEQGSRAEDIELARAEVAKAVAAATLARTTLDRQVALADSDVASHQVHDTAQADYDEALSAQRGAEATLALALAGPRPEEIAQARAALAAARSTFSMAERRLSDAVLTAPSVGMILSRVREPGSIVAAGEPILTMALTSPVWVRSYVDEPDLGRIAPGMTAEIRTDSGGVYSGQIGFISPVAEFTPRSVETKALRTSLVYRLRVIVTAPDDGLRQGMPVTVILKPKQD